MKFAEAKRAAVKKFDSPEFLERIKEEDATMLRHLPVLQEINRLGFLTTESQAGLPRRGIQPLTQKKQEIQERAYITGFMKEDLAQEFIKKMGIQTDKNAVYIASCSDDVQIPSSLDIPLTIAKVGGETKVHTHTSVVQPKSHVDFLKRELHLDKREKVVAVLCWDPQWNRNAGGKSGLFTQVLESLKN